MDIFANFLPDQALFLAFIQVVMIDLLLAGDNAVVVGMAAAGLSKADRHKAILIGVGLATIMRIVFALMASVLLSIVGLLFAGGLLLLWVSWKMWREIRVPDEDDMFVFQTETDSLSRPAEKTYKSAILNIIIADISMSLDNVLAVSGAAYEHPMVLIFGLALSVVLMGLAASFIAGLLNKHRWIAYFGLATILLVALKMIYQGGEEITLWWMY